MTSPRVMLDAGHYGLYNRSPAVPEYYESLMSWELHLLLAAELRKYGISVGATREKQEIDLPVYSRGRMAAGYDMFISLHSNATGRGADERVDRPVVYRLTADSVEGERFARRVADAVRDLMGTVQPGRVATRQGDPGREYYGVLRGASDAGCPHAFIFEHSFHTASAPARWLLSEDNLRRLAAAEAALIADFFGVGKPADDNIEKEDSMTSEERVYVDALEKRVAELEKANKVYHTYDQLPGYARETIERLHRTGVFAGAGAGDMQLTHEMMRVLLILAKQGVI